MEQANLIDIVDGHYFTLVFNEVYLVRAHTSFGLYINSQCQLRLNISAALKQIE